MTTKVPGIRVLGNGGQAALTHPRGLDAAGAKRRRLSLGAGSGVSWPRASVRDLDSMRTSSVGPEHTPRSISVGSERALAVLWQKAPTLRHGLVTQDGRRLRVIYPGRPNHRAGPDFHDAIISNEDDEILRGDVELHLNAPDWYGHRHHEDANYNGVVLHVVLHPKRSTQSRQHTGLKAPIVSLGSVAAVLDEAKPPLLDVLPESTADGGLTVGETLDLAGDERFLGRSKGLTMDLDRQGDRTRSYTPP